MYCIINNKTRDIIYIGTRNNCEIYIEKLKPYTNYKILKILQVEDEIIPYDEYIPSRFESYKKC